MIPDQILADLEERSGQIRIDGDVSVSNDSCNLQLRATGQQLTINFETSSCFFNAIRRRAQSIDQRIVRFLNSSGLSLELSVKERIVAQMGRDSNPGLLARMTGFKHVNISWTSLFNVLISHYNPFT